MIRQSPNALLRTKSPELADAVETIEARGVVAGQQTALRGFSSPDKDLHIVQLSIGIGKGAYDFTMQFNPGGDLTVTHSLRDGDQKSAPAVVLDMATKRDSGTRRPSIAESQAKMAGVMVEMAMLPARVGLGMMGAATTNATAAAQAARGVGDNLVQLSAYTRPDRKAGSERSNFARTNTNGRQEPVNFDNPAEALASLQQWAAGFLPATSVKRKAAAPAPQSKGLNA